MLYCLMKKECLNSFQNLETKEFFQFQQLTIMNTEINEHCNFNQDLDVQYLFLQANRDLQFKEIEHWGLERFRKFCILVQCSSFIIIIALGRILDEADEKEITFLAGFLFDCRCHSRSLIAVVLEFFPVLASRKSSM